VLQVLQFGKSAGQVLFSPSRPGNIYYELQSLFYLAPFEVKRVKKDDAFSRLGELLVQKKVPLFGRNVLKHMARQRKIETAVVEWQIGAGNAVCSRLCQAIAIFRD